MTTQPVNPLDLASMRISYGSPAVNEADLPADWLTQFERWLADAVAAGVVEPNAMVLATVTTDGGPASRTVLAKGIDSAGVTFYTNYGSAKSADLVANPQAAVTFPWYLLQRQVNIRGTVERVDARTTAEYWATRPRGSQLGAWASPQSELIAGREVLDGLQAAVEARFGGGAKAVDAPSIPVPPHWGGWRIVPQTVEFWQGQRSRMHDRLRYRRLADGSWVIERLAP